MTTTTTNMQTVANTSSHGLTVVFPDVCKTPAEPRPVPLPYPGFATTAVSSQKKKQAVKMSGSAFASTSGNEPGTLKGVASTTKTMGSGLKMTGAQSVMLAGGAAGFPLPTAKQSTEAQQLRGTMGELHNKLVSMTAPDPNQWQAVLADYALAAGALYLTLRGDV
jgi:uncharacterized protein DUF4150